MPHTDKFKDDSEPENAHLRTVLRRLAVILAESTLGAPEGNRRAAVALIEETLRRPRTNDAVIDRLERTIGDLQSRLLDQRVLKTEKSVAEFGAAEAARHRQAALNELAAVRQAIRPRAAAHRPTYNHTREDSPQTPCPQCAPWQQPDAKFLAGLGADIRSWADQGVLPVRARAAEIEGELLEISAALAARPLQEIEARAVEHAADRERLLYWLCVALEAVAGTAQAEPHEVTTESEIREVLASFGYDDARVAQMLALGEPGKGAVKPFVCTARMVRVGRPEEDADDCINPEPHNNLGIHRWRCKVCLRLASLLMPANPPAFWNECSYKNAGLALHAFLSPRKPSTILCLAVKETSDVATP